MKKVLIALDNGKSAEQVAKHGFKMARQLQAEIAILSVTDTRHLMTAGGVSVRDIVDITKNEFGELHTEIIAKFSPDKQVENFIEEGNPFEKILESAANWQADLIVMGTHGRTGISHLLMGSIAEKVIRHSTIQVLIIPTRED